MSKRNVIILVFFQIFFMGGIIEDIIKDGKISSVENTSESIIGVVIFMIICIGIYFYIIKKFWKIRDYLIYKIFAILNIIYMLSLIKNSIFIIIGINGTYITIVEILLVAFLIGNIILIITYNKNIVRLAEK